MDTSIALQTCRKLGRSGLLTEEWLVELYRKVNPRSRVTSILKFTHNGSSIKRMGCVLCGWEGPTWCAHYPITNRAASANAAHIMEHLRGEHRLTKRSLEFDPRRA